jgi:hypothetical protein
MIQTQDMKQVLQRDDSSKSQISDIGAKNPRKDRVSMRVRMA